MANTGNPRDNVTTTTDAGPPAPQVAPALAPPSDRPAPSVIQSKAPRRSANKTNAAPTVHPLLHGVANIPFFGIQGSTSSFVPDATAMYNALEIMDMHMSTIRRFYENSPMWNPLVSQAYFGILWSVQIMLCAQNAGELDQSSSEFLTWFLGMFPLQNLAIPGPLAPYFRSIGVCSGPYEHYGDVTPVTPPPSGKRENMWFLTHGHNRLFPPVHVFVDQLCFLGNLNANIIANAAAYPVRIYTNVFGVDVPAAGAAANPWNVIGLFPGIANRWHISATHIQTWHANRMSLSLPPRMMIGATNAPNIRGPNRALAVGEYLRFATAGVMHPQWFVNVVSIMQRYCQFFSGSSSIASVPVNGFGASIPVWVIKPDTQRDDNRDPTYQTVPTHSGTPAAPVTMNVLSWPVPTNQGMPAYTGDPTMIPNADGSDPNRLARQFSAATQVNVSHARLTTGDTYADLPPQAHTHFGPLWALSLTAQSTDVDNTLVSGQNILGMFVNDTRIN